MRNTQEEGERGRYRELYIKQKKVVQERVHEAITEHERKVTNEIRCKNNSGRNLWKNVNKLWGK